MLYFAYLPKNNGNDLNERKLNQMLKWYTTTIEKDFSVIASPGFLSRSESGTKKYIEGLKDILNANDSNIKFGFLNGMNGHYKYSDGKSYIKKHYDIMTEVKTFNPINFITNTKTDHRKMMCLFKTRFNFKEEIKTKSEIDNFLEKTKIYAILIGSSNQSNTTYFEKTAKKGEADIFIFEKTNEEAQLFEAELSKLSNDDVSIQNDSNLPQFLENIVITKSFCGEYNKDAQNFLKSVLKEMLVCGLDI